MQNKTVGEIIDSLVRSIIYKDLLYKDLKYLHITFSDDGELITFEYDYKHADH